MTDCETEGFLCWDLTSVDSRSYKVRCVRERLAKHFYPRERGASEGRETSQIVYPQQKINKQKIAPTIHWKH